MYKVVYFDISENPFERYLNFDSQVFDRLPDAIGVRNEYQSYVLLAFVVEIDDNQSGTFKIIL